MKVLLALSAILAVCNAAVIITAHTNNPHNLGSEECTWGPSYWCETLKTASGCNAVKHCIKSVWESLDVPEDNDSVCSICKDMVQQARDQLESNQTQNDLKAVFEGSCMLIHIKPIVKECITLVDQFIPELVETLASQMNPSVVCSVAGLCNSAHFDKLLADYKVPEVKTMKEGTSKSHALTHDELEPDECAKCITVATHMEHKLSHASKQQVLERMLIACGELGTFSDACAATVITYFDDIYSHLKQYFNRDSICHLSGQCSMNFHRHENNKETTPKVEIRPLSSVGMVDVGDTLPCKLCLQLVSHFRDLIVANTTESEFKEIMIGLCHQTKSFAPECLKIIDQYYAEMYKLFVNGMSGHLLCTLGGICPIFEKSVPVWPLLPARQVELGMRLLKKEKKNSASPEIGEAETMQLPLERMMPFPIKTELDNVDSKESCALCEYVLHFIQQEITKPETEAKLEALFEEVCTKMPKSLKNECDEFVKTYSGAIVAILVQQIDPSQVCPTIHLCPSPELTQVWEQAAKYGALEEAHDQKPSCPLCLLAVTQVYNAIKDNKTEANIKAQLNKLCKHLPESLIDECTDLVNAYTKELVEMLLADLTPQEVCVYLKLCDAESEPGPQIGFHTDKNGEILSNEIPNYPSYPVAVKPKVESDVTCVVCEFVMQYVDKAIGTKKSKDEISKIVHGVCNYLPKTVSRQCNQFVDQYADVLIDILSQEVTPKEVCTMISLCSVTTVQLKASVAECALCQAILSTIDRILGDPKIDAKIEDAVAEVCRYLPASKHDKCHAMVKIYGQSIINLIRNHDNPKMICNKMALCSSNDYLALSLQSPRMRRSYINDIKRCTWGSMFVCSNLEVATQCRVVEYCKENVWKGEYQPEAK